MREIVLEAPSWVGEEEARKKFLHYLMGEALMKSEYYRSLMKPFERKYSISFPDFRKKLNHLSGKISKLGTT